MVAIFLVFMVGLRVNIFEVGGLISSLSANTSKRIKKEYLED